MRERTHLSPAWMLALLVACGASVATGQQIEASRWPAEAAAASPADASASFARESALQAYPLSTSAFSAQEKDLTADVAELKAAMKKIKDKEEADKKKAAAAPSCRVGGRIHFDYAAFDQNANSIQQAGDMLNGTEFRRARLQVQGDAFYVVDYKFQYDFAGTGQTAFKDVYVTVKELPWIGNIRAGHFYECWGLETQTSSNYITFMERSLVSSSGGIGDRKSGIMAFDWNEAETMTWAAGAFAWQVGERPPLWPSGVYDDAGGTAFDARCTWLPWYDEATQGRGLLHTGISYTYRDVAELRPGQTGRYSVTSKPEANLGTNVVDTGGMNDAARISAFMPEVAFVYGPFSVQGEYRWMWLDRSANADPMFDGGYIYVSYFLTGENRAYDRKAGVFSRVKPNENFFRVRGEDCSIYTGKGAWELAYRASYLNLNSAGVLGGRVVDHTAGINWYLSPYTRFMLNFVHSETIGRDAFVGSGIVNLVETRCQFDF